jgi:hypothetical protein
MNFWEGHAKKWPVSAIVAFLGAFLMMALCQKVFKDDRNSCLVPYIFLQLLAAAFSAVVGLRGNRWWLLMTLLATALAVQAFIALLVE